MDDSGAEPLEHYEIEEIPKVKISLEQSRNSLQCSVCLEYFKVNEEAKVLPCSHHFHEGCIDPWLERRGTCPDCRRNLVPDFAIDDTATEEFIDEETLSGNESAHSNMIPSYVSIVTYDRSPENIYYEDIEDEDESAFTGDESFRNLNDIYSNDFASSFSNDMTITEQSTLLASNDEIEPAGQASDSVNDTMIPSSPSIITISDTSDEDVEIFGNSFEISSESYSDRMSIDSESVEEISIFSSSDLTMQDD